MYIYLDESGSLTKSSEKYFVVCSYTVGKSRRVAKAFRRWQKTKFPRKIKGQSEVKFNDPHIDDKLRVKTIRFLAKQDIRIFYAYLTKKNIPKEYHREGKVYETGLLYTKIVGDTLELYLPLTEIELRVFRDQRILKGVVLSDFNEHLMARLLPQLPAKTILQIQAMDSTASPQIQVADWICGALARYHEKKPLGDEFYKILKNNIVEEKELFSDYWTKRWEK